MPFSITPFDVDKALKWREQLKQGMLDRSLRWALDYLDEVDSAWVNSSIPAGPRMDQEINYVTGSIYVQLSIERPREIAPAEQLETYYTIWTPLAPILAMPVKRIVEQLTSIERDKDAFYQREVAPIMAARWADRLELRVGGRELPGIDFTLASSYRFGSTVRIDFTAPISGVARRQLEDFTLLATQHLPVGSVANVKSMTLHYYTDHYNRRIQSVPTTDDLINPANGQPDPGANLHVPLTPWEAQNQRREIEDAVERLITHLNANLVYYHKVIWWLMDRDELYMLLDGFTAPYGRRFENGAWVEDTGRSIASVVERDPMAILGNTLVMRVAAGAFLGIDGHDSPEAANRYYYDSQVRTEPLRVSLPTEGLYAQALMDKCEACEEHHGSTDWVLTNGEPELETLADQLGTRRQAPTDLTPTQMPQSIISLQNAPAAPDPTGLAGILQAVTTSNAFRDMAGLAGTQANAMGALTQAASLAQSFGQMAVDFQKSKQGTADAKQKLSNIEKAKSAGLIDDAEAQRQSARALDDQNMAQEPTSLTNENPINSALSRASAAGQSIEVSRQTQHGTELVRVGAPLVPRNAAACPEGSKNLGTLLIVHDAETEIDLRDYGGYTDATAWILIHTVSDLIEALRAYVGSCNFVRGIHIEAHGGWHGSGGFRLGDDTDGDGHVEGSEANDFVSSQSQAAKFGTIIKNALAPDGFISIAACGSAGNNNDFIKTLQATVGTIVIGSPSSCRSGGNWFSGAWWEVDNGRAQVNRDGTIKVDPSDDGNGIWQPF